LGGVDMVVFIAALLMFVRILRNEKEAYESVNSQEGEVTSSPRKKLSGKKLFHGIIVLFLLVRGTFFLANPFYINSEAEFYSDSMDVAWKQLGSLLFFLAYFFLLLFWADFYYRVSRSHIRVFSTLRTPLLIFLALLGGLVIAYCVVAVALEMPSNTAGLFDDVSACVIASLSLMVAVGFLYYGIRLVAVLRGYSSLSLRKQTQTRKVVAVAVGCTLCFSFQAIFILYSAALQIERGTYSKEWDVNNYVVFLFFFCLETLPVVSMLYLLRKQGGPQRPLLEAEATPIMKSYR